MTWQGFTTYSIAASGTLGSASNICRKNYEITSNGETITATRTDADTDNDVSVVICCNADGTMDAVIVDPDTGLDATFTSASGPIVINCAD